MAKQRIGMAAECLDWGVSERVRIPVVRKDSGLGYGGWQHVGIGEPVNDPAALFWLSLKLPRPRRLGLQAMNSDNAVQLELDRVRI